jgi:hypothetical protein
MRGFLIGFIGAALSGQIHQIAADPSWIGRLGFGLGLVAALILHVTGRRRSS